METRIEWAVFDLGNVVLTATTAMAELAGLLGTTPERLLDAYDEHRLDYDRHSDPADYWRRVAETAKAAAPDEALIKALVIADDLGWSTTDPEMLQLIDDLRLAGVHLAVLSNAPASMGRLVKAAAWSAGFEVMLFSGDHGMVKPDPAVFRLLLDRLSTAADRTVFLDDRLDNVAGARAVGMQAIRFSSAAQACTDLRALGLPV